MLKEFERPALTTRNLNKQCVEAFEVADDVLQRVLNVPKMPSRRRNYQALTQIEVIHFVGWWPFRSCDKFNQYRIEHPDLEPFPPTDYGFGTTKHAVEAGTSDRGGVSQGPSS